jgi:hypothetical protein
MLSPQRPRTDRDGDPCKEAELPRLMQGTDGVVYTPMDTGDKLWGKEAAHDNRIPRIDVQVGSSSHLLRQIDACREAPKTLKPRWCVDIDDQVVFATIQGGH